MENIKIIKKYEDNLDDKLNKAFNQGIEMLIGEYQINNYNVERKYINGQTQQIKLHFTKFEPKDPKATIAIVHGLGEYSGRYMHIADYFATNGFIVIMLDMSGFGLSGGARGCSTQDELHKDVEILLNQARNDLPLFLYGHSMGGGIVLTIGQRNPDLKLAGIIATSPLIKLQKSKKISNTQIHFLRLLLGGLQDFVLHPQLNLSSLSKNDRFCIEYIQDKNIVSLLNGKAVKSLMEHTLYLFPNCKKQKFPFLICHGEKDGIVDFESSVEYFNHCSNSQDKKLESFENGYHELHNDEEYLKLRKIILDWCNERVQNAEKFQQKTLNCGFILENPLVYLFKRAILFILLLLALRIFFKIIF